MTTHHWRFTPVSADTDKLGEWSELYRQQSSTPLLHPDFLRTALEVFGRRSTRIGVCVRAGDVVAACVVDSVDALRLTTFQPSQAPIGFWLQSRGESMVDLLGSLSREQAPWVVSMAVTQQDPELLARPEACSSLLLTDYIDTARISIVSDWESYWKARGSNLRHNIKRGNAKLATAGKSVELRLIVDPSAMSDAVATYGRIESLSWKASEGTAVTPDNDQGRFYAALLERFARRGRARCYQLLIDGQVAATDLCVCGDDEIVILKTTYDANYKDYSPAFLMRELAFKRLYAEGWCRRIEFYGRVMDWHLRWTDEVRRMYHVTWFRYPGALALRRALRRFNRTPRELAAENPALPQAGRPD